MNNFITLLDEFGHILVYGPTNSGKTTLSKYIISKMQFKEVIIFTTSPDQYLDFTIKNGKVSTYQTEEDFNRVIGDILNNDSQQYKQQYNKNQRHCIVFDDFNESINVRSNELYKDVFQRGRHKGFRVINLCHHTNAIGSAARSNSKYLFIAGCIQRGELKKMNEYYMKMSQMELIQKFDEASGDIRNYVFYDTQTRQFITIHSTEFFNCDDSDDDQQQPKTFVNEVEAHPNSTIAQGGQPHIFNPISSMNLLNKKAGRDFIDNSKNIINVEQRIKNQQRIEDQSVNHYLAMQQIQNVDKQERLKSKFMLRDMILKDPKTPKDIQYIIFNLNKSIKSSQTQVTLDNWQPIAEQFMEQCCGIKCSLQKRNPKKNQLSQLLTDVPAIGQEIVNANPSNLLETSVGLIQIMKPYFKQIKSTSEPRTLRS